MPLNVPDGTGCFVDANILYYALVPTPIVSDPCVELLNRAIARRIPLSASISVLSDAIHKVMISEVAHLTGRDRAGLIGYLGKHPDIIKKLVEYPQAMARLNLVPLNILPIDNSLLHEATGFAVALGLLTNDAMIVALMRRHGLTHLVTNDNDFDRIADLTIWKPR